MAKVDRDRDEDAKERISTPMNNCLKFLDDLFGIKE